MKKYVTLMICLLSCLTIVAQNKPQASFTFDHLALAVKDLNRSAEFYTNVFQLKEITNRTANPTIRWISLGDGKELHLITNSESVVINKTIHLALATDNLDAFTDRLKQMKIAYADWGGTPNTFNVRADGIKQIYLQDPDGYWIEINNAREKK